MSDETGETLATTSTKKANRAAGPITIGMACVLVGGIVVAIGSAVPDGAPAAAIGGVGILAGLYFLLDGVHRLVENLDNATQALLDRNT